jgi:hypothetical protein
MAPISRRMTLVFVMALIAFSCSGAASAADSTALLGGMTIDSGASGVIGVTTEGFVEERAILPGDLALNLREMAEDEVFVLENWPVSPGDHRPVRLRRQSVYGPDTHIFELGADGMREVPRSARIHFVGSVDGEPGSGVLIVLDPRTGRLNGLAVSGGAVFDLIPVDGGSASEVRVVATSDRLAGEDPFWDCGGDSLDWPVETHDLARESTTKAAVSGPLEAVLAIDTDTELMSQKFSGSTAAAVDYIADLIAAMNVMYSRDLDVTLVQGTTFLRTSSDPYSANSGSNASSAELNEFRSYWSSHYGSVQRTVAAMLSGKSTSSNSASGIAFIGGLCSTSSGYSFSKVFKVNYLAGDAKLVGHEIGHNFGSPHTHCYSPPIDRCYSGESGCYNGSTSCPGGPGTVMSYCHVTGCGSTLNFHPTVVNRILNSYVAPATGVCIFPATSDDTIFSDGFEGGGTGSWSDAAP